MRRCGASHRLTGRGCPVPRQRRRFNAEEKKGEAVSRDHRGEGFGAREDRRAAAIARRDAGEAQAAQAQAHPAGAAVRRVRVCRAYGTWNLFVTAFAALTWG